MNVQNNVRSQTADKVIFVLSLIAQTHALKPLLATSNILSLGIANGKSLTAVLESLKLLSTAPRQFANTLTAQKIMTVLIAGSKFAKTIVTFTIAQSGTLRVKTGLAKSASQKRHCCPMYAPN